MSDLRVNFTSNESRVIFSATDDHGMLEIAPDGFYVRGEKVPQDEHEARRIYDAFMEWMQRVVFEDNPGTAPPALTPERVREVAEAELTDMSGLDEFGPEYLPPARDFNKGVVALRDALLEEMGVG